MKSNARDGERGSSCRSGETPGRSADKGCCDYLDSSPSRYMFYIRKVISSLTICNFVLSFGCVFGQ